MLIPSQKLHGYDFKSIHTFIEEEKKAFVKNGEKYLLEIFNQKESRLFSLLNIKNKHFSRKYRAQMALFYLSFLNDIKKNNRLYSRKGSIKKAYHYLNNNVRERFVSSDYTLGNFSKWFKQNKYTSNSEPFFIWLHLSDLHDSAFTSHDYNSNTLKYDLKDMKSHMNKMNLYGTHEGNRFYDLSIRYTDKKVAELINFFKKLNLWDDMLLVLISDHGSKGLHWPKRNYDNGIIRTVDFYDELYHVPVAFHHKDINNRDVSSLTSLIDFAPTLLSFAGLKIPTSFKGNVVHGNEDGREYLNMENLGPGPCDFNFKPMNITIRSKDNKLNLTKSLIKGDGSVQECYDLSVDPYEQNNLACSGELGNSFSPLLNKAYERFKEIEKQSFV